MYLQRFYKKLMLFSTYTFNDLIKYLKNFALHDTHILTNTYNLNVQIIKIIKTSNSLHRSLIGISFLHTHCYKLFSMTFYYPSMNMFPL